MNLLFSHPYSFLPEQSGRVVFEENKEVKEIVSPQVLPKEIETKTTDLDISVDTNILSKTIEKQTSQNSESKDVQESTDSKQENQAQSIENQEKIQEGLRKKAEIEAAIAADLGPESSVKYMTAEQYAEHLRNVAKKHSPSVDDWEQDYLKIIPDNYGADNFKMGAIAGVLAYGSTNGTTWERIKSAGKWTLGVAFFTHPILTAGLAKILTVAGKEVIGPAIAGGGNLLISLLENPQELWNALKETDVNNLRNVPLLHLLNTGRNSSQEFATELATGTQNAFELRAKGLVIGDKNLDDVMAEVESYKAAKKAGKEISFSDKNIKGAATFVLQMAEHKLSEEELARLRLKLWNREASASDIRRILATNAEREMLSFFTKDAVLWDRFRIELENQKIAQAEALAKKEPLPIPKADLAKMFLDGTAVEGARQFDLAKPKRGVRRFLSMGLGGMALAVYLLSFFSISMLMGMKSLFHKSTYKEIKDTTINFGKSGITGLAGLVGLGKSKSKEIKTEEGIQILKKYASADDSPLKGKETLIWDKMTTPDKKALIAQTKDFVKKEQQEEDWKCEKEDLPAIIQSKLKELERSKS